MPLSKDTIRSNVRQNVLVTVKQLEHLQNKEYTPDRLMDAVTCNG